MLVTNIIFKILYRDHLKDSKPISSQIASAHDVINQAGIDDWFKG